MLKIGKDLREIRENGTLGPVVGCHHIRIAIGIRPGKLPLGAIDKIRVGDTFVAVLSRHDAQSMSPQSHRPHRMFAECNHCKRLIPTGRFGQHLHIHPAVQS